MVIDTIKVVTILAGLERFLKYIKILFVIRKHLRTSISKITLKKFKLSVIILKKTKI